MAVVSAGELNRRLSHVLVTIGRKRKTLLPQPRERPLYALSVEIAASIALRLPLSENFHEWNQVSYPLFYRRPRRGLEAIHD